MNTYKEITEAQTALVTGWGKTGEHIIELCATCNPFNGPFTDFLEHCTACGGNWGGLLLSGINKLYPKVYDAIPENMGMNAFSLLCCVIVLLGVDCS
jgi:hypothetical protein